MPAEDPPFEDLIAGTQRTAVHLEMRDAYARAAMAALPPQKHSLTLRMLLAEIEGHQFGH